jgi:hypothetical protein
MPPHDWQMALVHTRWIPPVDAQAFPEPTQELEPAVPVSQHPFALHWSPGQHACAVFPHGTHALPWQTVVVVHDSPVPTHTCVCVLQQPPLHTLPAQQVVPT